MGYIELKGQLGRKVHDDLTHLPGILGGGPPGHLGSPPCDLLSSSRLDLFSGLREASQESERSKSFSALILEVSQSHFCHVHDQNTS